MKSKRILINVSLLAVFVSLYTHSGYSHGGAGFKAKFEKIMLDSKTIDAVGIKIQKVEQEDVFESIKSTGQIEEISNNHFNINSPVEGTVTSVHVSLGSKVRVGTPLATIESPEVSRLQAEIYKLKAELEYANNNYEREQSLFADGISPKKDFDVSKAQLSSAEAKLIAAESNLKILTRLAIQSAQGRFNLLSRMNGTIVESHITVGEVVSPSKLLFHGIDLSSVWASANIYEKDFGKAVLGQKVDVFLDGAPIKVYSGMIVYIASVLDEQSRTLPVKVQLDNAKGELNPGAFVKLIIYTKNKKKSIVIPTTALVDIESDRNNDTEIHKHIVYLKDDNTFIPQEVEVATHDSNSVEVLSGLKAGDEVVISGGYQLQFAEGGHDEEEEHDGHNLDKHSSHKHEAHGHSHHKKTAKSTNIISNKLSLYIPIFLALIFGLILGVLFGRKKNK